jgi:uncharacterized Zn finger protein
MAALHYLVVIPPHRHSEARFVELDSAAELAVGDDLLVEELLLRVQSIVDTRSDDGYEATIVASPLVELD